MTNFGVKWLFLRNADKKKALQVLYLQGFTTTRPKGLEPSTFGSTVRCSNQLSYGPILLISGGSIPLNQLSRQLFYTKHSNKQLFRDNTMPPVFAQNAQAGLKRLLKMTENCTKSAEIYKSQQKRCGNNRF